MSEALGSFEPELLDIDAAAMRSGINKHALRKGVQRRAWPHHRIGSRVLFSRSDLDRIVELTAVQPQPEPERPRAT